MVFYALKLPPPTRPHPQAEVRTLQDWAAFASLALSCTWTAEWFVVLDAPRPVARFRPADVVAIPMRKVGPFEFWRPEDGKRQRRAARGGPLVPEEAWAAAEEVDPLLDDDEEVAPEEHEEEGADDDGAEAFGVSKGSKGAPHTHTPVLHKPRLFPTRYRRQHAPTRAQSMTQMPSPHQYARRCWGDFQIGIWLSRSLRFRQGGSGRGQSHQ